MSNSKIKRDNSIVSDKAVLAKEISQKYNTVYHSNWKIEHDKINIVMLLMNMEEKFLILLDRYIIKC